MNKLKLKSEVGLLLALGILVTSCGGSGGGESSSSSSGGGSSESYKAQFIDSPVEGIAFVNSSSQTLYTDSDGYFKCTKGETVTAKLGNLELGKATCGDKIFPHNLTGDHTVTATDAGTYLSALLQTIDEDSDPSNGIKIPAAVRSINDFPAIDFHKDVFDPTISFNDMNTLISKIDNSKTFASKAAMDTYISSDVIPHLRNSAETYLGDVKEKVDEWEADYDGVGAWIANNTVSNDSGSPCSYDSVSFSMGYSNTSKAYELSLRLQEDASSGSDNRFKYLVTEFPKMTFANTFDADSDPYRMIITLEFKNGKVKGTFKDDPEFTDGETCSGTFTLN